MLVDEKIPGSDPSDSANKRRVEELLAAGNGHVAEHDLADGVGKRRVEELLAAGYGRR